MSKLVVIAVVVGWALVLVQAQQPEAATRPATQPAKLPADVIAAQEKMTAWVNSLYGKTEPEIVTELGEPSQRDIDRDGDPVLKYMTSEKGSLHLYFSKRQRVILASYGVTS
jgi:hypothetical protein